VAGGEQFPGHAEYRVSRVDVYAVFCNNLATTRTHSLLSLSVVASPPAHLEPSDARLHHLGDAIACQLIRPTRLFLAAAAATAALLITRVFRRSRRFGIRAAAGRGGGGGAAPFLLRRPPRLPA